MFRVFADTGLYENNHSWLVKEFDSIDKAEAFVTLAQQQADVIHAAHNRHPIKTIETSFDDNFHADWDGVRYWVQDAD